MKIIKIYLSEVQDAKLREVAEATDLKYAEHVRRAIDNYLERLGVYQYATRHIGGVHQTEKQVGQVASS